MAQLEQLFQQFRLEPCPERVIKPNVLFLTAENEILRIIYSLFRDRQNIFIKIFSTKFVIKLATKILKIG